MMFDVMKISFQLQLKCEMKEDWMWQFICSEWHTNNATACSRDENNVVALTAYVRNNHVELIKNCLLFEIQYAQYQDKCRFLMVAITFGDISQSAFGPFQ